MTNIKFYFSPEREGTIAQPKNASTETQEIGQTPEIDFSQIDKEILTRLRPLMNDLQTLDNAESLLSRAIKEKDNPEPNLNLLHQTVREMRLQRNRIITIQENLSTAAELLPQTVQDQYAVFKNEELIKIVSAEQDALGVQLSNLSLEIDTVLTNQ